ncbi:hypothetical protein AAEU29_11425 [Pseudoalteromonas sp. SSM20]|uniref:hypothetical protein n=1 Tax=Pseudoalteromonas sp. SSM20 TaxID=3139394 RepID=UPI003BAA624B
MSEDNLTIKFTSENLRDNHYRAELEEIYEKHIPKDEGDESSIEYAGNKATYFRAFFSIDSEALNSLLSELEKKGVYDLAATAWYDNVGEEMYFIRRSGELLDFSSKKDMDEYLKEADKGKLNTVINYGKTTKKNTLLIRLHIKAKGKRKKLFELFSLALNHLKNNNFKQTFNSFVKSESHDIEWCRFKWKEDETWNEVCSEELSIAITDALENDEYLLIAFNLDQIPTDSNIVIDDFIWFIFNSLDGVRKVWVKYRPKDDIEQYLYFPGMGDESFFVGKEIKNDNDWPKL